MITRQPDWPEGLYIRGGVYYARLRVNGHRRLHSLKTEHLPTAKVKLMEYGVEMAALRKLDPTSDRAYRTLGSLAKIAENELERSPLKAGSMRVYRQALERLRLRWRGNFETTSVTSVDRGTLYDLRDRMSDLAPMTVNMTLTLLRRMLELARSRKVILSNPFDEYSMVRKSVYAKHTQRVPVMPSTEDMERIFLQIERIENEDTLDPWNLAKAKSSRRIAAKFARFLAYTGCRLEEARTATAKDDLGDWFLIHGTKTVTSERRIPVIRELRTLLDQMKAERPFGKLIETKACRAHLHRACRELGLPQIGHHDLRHYFATVCIEQGAPVPTVADWLGHSDGGKLLLGTYRHMRDADALSKASKISFAPSASALPAPASAPASQELTAG